MGGFHKKTVKDIELKNKRVLMRVDYNLPLSEHGAISDDYRIIQSLPTIEYLLKQNCKIIIISHLGRPTGPDDIQFSLAPVAKRLGELLKRKVQFSPDCVGPDVEAAAKKLKSKEILLLENLRFHKTEEENNDAFAQQLASLADVFVQDAFGVAHRAHASLDAVTKHLKAVAGLLLEKEIVTINRAMNNPDRPLMAIVGGVKISDKIGVLNKFIDIADVVAIGGAMANTFLLADGFKVGKSVTEPDVVETARDILDRARARMAKERFVFYMPQDGVVARELDAKEHTRVVDWDSQTTADILNYPKPVKAADHIVQSNEMILDIGPYSAAFIAGLIHMSHTVVWSGTVGVAETRALHGAVGPFEHGSRTIYDALSENRAAKPFSVVGGGDTASYILEVASPHTASGLNHISTGGGASLDLMAGKKLPGVEALLDKKA